MKKTPQQELEKEKLLEASKKAFPSIDSYSCRDRGLWLLPDGDLKAIGEHYEVSSPIREVYGYETMDNIEQKLKENNQHIGQYFIQFFQRSTDSIRVRCEDYNLNIELNEEQELPTKDQEKKLKDLMCNGQFRRVFVDIVEPNEEKFLWDSFDGTVIRKNNDKSLDYEFDLGDCEKVTDRAITKFAIKQREDLSKIYKL